MATVQLNETAAIGKQHADHDYVVARQAKYIAAWSSGDVNALMDFMDKETFVYNNRSDAGQADFERDEIRNVFEKTFSNFYDLEIKTVSIHGHKNFTTWEWDMSCKPALNDKGEKQPKEKCSPMHLQGCTLMWWNDKDKIIEQHEYVQVQDGT